jgi:hypothetical protein
VLYIESVEAVAKLDDPMEKRLRSGGFAPVAVLELADDEFGVHAQVNRASAEG